MESSKLPCEIENIIHKNLYYAYNKSTPKVFFTEHIDPTIFNGSISLENFTANFPQNSDRQIESSSWRIPQSRIYYNQFSSAEISIGEFRCYGTSILIIRNFSSDDLQIKLTPKHEKIYDCINEEFINDELISKAGYTSILYSGPLKLDTKIDKYIARLIEQERKYHPLSYIRSTDVDFLKAIDRYWNEIPWIDSTGNILESLDESEEISKSIFVLLSQLPQYFPFVKPVNMETSRRGEGVFYSLYLQETKLDTYEVKANIQSFWNVISLPAFRKKLINLLNTNPAEIIAFLLLTLHNGFWWSKIAIQHIVEFLDEKKSGFLALYNLVFELKSHVFIASKNSDLFIANNTSSLGNKSYELSNGRYTLKLIKTKQNCYTHLFIDGTEKIVINRDVKIAFTQANQELQILPQSFEYKLVQNNVLALKVNSISVKILMAWNDFVLQIGSLRLKFLFKRDRYQVSLKGDRSIRNLELNGNSISFESNRYQKTYIYPQKSREVISINFYDSMGQVLNPDQIDTSGKILINGVAQNKYDQIIDRVHVRKKHPGKNNMIHLITDSPDTLHVRQHFDLIVPGNGRVSFELKHQSSLLSQILLSRVPLLENQLNIYSADENQIIKLRESWYNTFKFYPNFYPLSEINNTFSSFCMIIADEYSGELVKLYPDYKEIKLRKHGQKRGLLFSPKSFENWLHNVQLDD